MREFSLAILLICAVITTGKTCRFIFPTLTDSNVVTARINTTIYVPFSIDPSCRHRTEKKFTIKIAKINVPPVRKYVCQMLQDDGQCTNINSPNCACPNKDGDYILSKIAERDDNTTWHWWIDFGKETKLTFHIVETDGAAEATQPTSQSANIAAHDDKDTHNDSGFLFTMRAVISGIAGFIALVILVIMIVCAKTGRRKTTYKMPEHNEIQLQPVPDYEHERPFARGRDTMYSEFSFYSDEEDPLPMETDEHGWPAPPPEAHCEALESEMQQHCSQGDLSLDVDYGTYINLDNLLSRK